MITRDAVLQNLLTLFEAPRYLEVGVSKGVTFHELQATEKVAVDPVFMFDVEAARRANTSSRYFEVTSDEYFGRHATPGEKFDLIYLDGLHTAEQTLRDLLNALLYLKPNGIIVIDDVKPRSHLASLPDRDQFFKVREHIRSESKSWMGDVYKVIYFIDTFLQQLSYRTIANNHGQAVVWQKRRPSVPERLIQDIGIKRFEDLVVEIDVLRVAQFQDILSQIRADMASA